MTTAIAAALGGLGALAVTLLVVVILTIIERRK